MTWDEETFGLEYDLDIYMVVAVDFFNMGAMENKGLNVFNTKYVLANDETATDRDYHNIESVIGHEYFHNWTGNRVTCRDWFQLSLKEGLTVFRDQQFSTDMGSPVFNRIEAVKVIRTSQFAEDAGPMSHPIRPDKVIEMNNFYTVTVYDKGAEVIRMMHALLGKEGFRKGMDLYFERHDGQAVTCDDFVQAMEDAGQVDLGRFRRWYSQSGTPVVVVKDSYDAENRTYTMDIEQINAPTADQTEKQPLHIPFDVELLDSKGQSMPLLIDGKPVNSVLNVLEQHNRFVFEQIDEAPVPVLLKNFSAPVKLEYDYSDEALLHLIAHASDDFSRWDACQSFYLAKVKQYLAKSEGFTIGEGFIEVCTQLLADESVDKILSGEVIKVPSFEMIAASFEEIDIDGINNALAEITNQLSSALIEPLLACHKHNSADKYDNSQPAIAARTLKNACLKLMAGHQNEKVSAVLAEQYRQSDNMTDTLGVLDAMSEANSPDFEHFMSDFEQQWQHDPLVMDKWFTLHAKRNSESVYDTIEQLNSHSVFNINNPNRVRAIYAAFPHYNSVQFHAADGRGYRLLTDLLLKLDAINPQTAARLVAPLLAFKRFDAARQTLVREQLQRLADLDGLSRDVYEKVSQALR